MDQCRCWSRSMKSVSFTSLGRVRGAARCSERAVTRHGVPFYAGRGLTSRLLVTVPRRTRRPTLDAAGKAETLLLYPLYLDPGDRLCPCLGSSGRARAALASAVPADIAVAEPSPCGGWRGQDPQRAVGGKRRCFLFLQGLAPDLFPACSAGPPALRRPRRAARQFQWRRSSRLGRAGDRFPAAGPGPAGRSWSAPIRQNHVTDPRCTGDCRPLHRAAIFSAAERLITAATCSAGADARDACRGSASPGRD